MQLLAAATGQVGQRDQVGGAEPVDVLVGAHVEPDAGPDDEQLRVLEQPVDLEPQLVGQPGVVVVARSHDAGGAAQQPGVARAGQPRSLVVDQHLYRPALPLLRQRLQRRVRLFLVVHDDAGDGPVVPLLEHGPDGEADELRATAGRQHDGDVRPGALRRVRPDDRSR